MINQDKFGREIYNSKFKILLKYGTLLLLNHYLESSKKPNLFYKKIKEGVFFCDMRGTDEVPIWQDTTPLFYFFPYKKVPRWKVNRLKDNEYSNLRKNIPIRISFYEDEEVIENYYPTIDKFFGKEDNKYFNIEEEDIYENGFCKFCNKDMQKEGIFCDVNCYEKFIQKKKKEYNDWLESRKIECPICKKRVEPEQMHEHHINYDEEDTILICSSCHTEITFHLDKYPKLKKYKPIGKRDLNGKKEKKFCKICKIELKDRRANYCPKHKEIKLKGVSHSRAGMGKYNNMNWSYRPPKPRWFGPWVK